MSKHVVPFQLKKGGGAAGGASDELQCEVEVGVRVCVAVAQWWQLVSVARTTRARRPALNDRLVVPQLRLLCCLYDTLLLDLTSAFHFVCRTAQCSCLARTAGQEDAAPPTHTPTY